MRALLCAAALLAAAAPAAAAAAFTARLVAPRGTSLPEKASLAVTANGGTETVPCAIADAVLTCSVAARRGDVRLDVPGFAALYFWNADLHERREIALRRGASLAGYASLESGRGDLTAAQIELAPADFAQTAEEARRIAAQSRTVRPRENGFFQFVDLAPGRYEIRARREGWSPSRALIVTVEAERETVLPRPLVLESLAALEVFITPPLAPDGGPWIVDLQSADGAGHQSHAGPDGRFEKTGLTSGIHVLKVLDSARTVHYSEGVEVTRSSAPQSIRLEHVPVRGRVSLGDDPFVGRVKFFQQNGGRRAVLETNDRGEFSGAVPRRGVWDVEVIPKSKRYGVRVDAIDVALAEGKEWAEIDIELEDGRVRGRLVDASGNGVRGTVDLFGPRRLAQDTTADDGTFEIIGVPRGELRIRGTAGGADSGMQAHRVGGPDDEPVTLVVHPQRRVRGRLVNRAGQPIAGAAIRYSAPALRRLLQVTTNPDGEFELRASHADAVVEAAVVAPPFATRVLTLPVDGPFVEVTLDRAYGTLLIRGTSNVDAWVRRGSATFVLDSLLAPARMFGERPENTRRGWSLTVEPGPYLVCARPTARDSDCEAVHVGSGAERVVDLSARRER